MDLDYIAGQLLALSAITEEEYFNFTSEPFVDSREFMLMYINSLHNKCTLCDRNKFRIKPIDDGSVIDKLPSIVFLSDTPHHLDNEYGKSFVDLNYIYSNHPNTLNQVKVFKKPLTMAEFPEIDFSSQESPDLKHWNDFTGYMGPFHTDGQVFQSIINNIGLPQESYIVEFLTRCPKFSATTIGHITKKEREVCNKWLQLKLSIINPKIVVGLGKQAGEFLFDTLPNPGTLLDREDTYSIMYTHHPGSPLYKLTSSEEMVTGMVEDLKRLHNYL